MAANTAITIKVRLVGARETLASFRRLPKEASDALRDRSQRIADTLAGRVASAARSDSRQSALMAGTVKAKRDRIPNIVAGGTAKVGRRRTPAYKIVFGSEFGSDRYRQFRPHVGKGSYWLYKTVAANESFVGDEWSKAADDIVRSFASGAVAVS